MRSSYSRSLWLFTVLIASACGGNAVTNDESSGPPDCASLSPSEGAACTATACTFDAGHVTCADGTTIDYSLVCASGVWTKQPNGQCPPTQDGGNEPLTCPTTAPTTGTACEGELDCYYGEHGDCTSGPGGVEFHHICKDNTWVRATVGSCPPPEAGAACPTSIPSSGSACEGNLSCSYGEHADCAPRGEHYRHVCAGGTWTRVTYGSCLPESFNCPFEIPEDGASCSEVMRCYYPFGSECWDRTAECLDGAWHIASSGVCPSTEQP